MLSAAFSIVLLNVVILSVNCLSVMAPLKLVDKVNSQILEWPLLTVVTPSVRKVFRVTESQVCNKLYLALDFLPDMTEFYFLLFFFQFFGFFAKIILKQKKKFAEAEVEAIISDAFRCLTKRVDSFSTNIPAKHSNLLKVKKLYKN
jgi:hypothetical protein